MNSTSLHIKVEPSIKKQAHETAEELGLSLSAVLKVLLKQFVRTKRLSVDANEGPEVPNARTRQMLERAREDMKAGRTVSFKSNKDALSYIDALIQNDKQLTK